MIKRGSRFYDVFNDRYLTVDAHHTSNVWYCVIEEMNYEDEEYEVVNSGLFTSYELLNMKEVS